MSDEREDSRAEAENLYIMNGIGLVSEDKLIRVAKKRDEALLLMRQLESGRALPKHLKPVHKRIQAYSKAANNLLDCYEVVNEINRGLLKEHNQVTKDATERSRKRWSDAEDSLLIEKASDGSGVQSLALAMGRTPGAITARISHLVGIRRISEHFAGGIRGYLNGKEVTGSFVGELKRGAS